MSTCLPLPLTLRRLLVLLLALPPALGACAGAPSLPGEPTPRAGGVPGFDTRDYPGDGAMRAWLDASPYRWVGYYLEAPCHPRSTWRGTRQRLTTLGWGTALIFVGEQDWPASAGVVLADTAAAADPVSADTTAAQPGAADVQCTRANLTAEKGAADAAQAQAGAAADGFPTGTVIYLDVEAVSSVSQALESYVRAWAEALLEGGRYTPGLYAHARNAERLYAIMADAFARAGRTQRPRLWVATSQGFDLGRIPLESGFATAYIWQGLFDTPETYGGITLRIDANVADSANPSR